MTRIQKFAIFFNMWKLYEIVTDKYKSYGLLYILYVRILYTSSYFRI